MAFYDKGTAPRKNIAMMQEVLAEIGPQAGGGDKKRKVAAVASTPKKRRKDKDKFLENIYVRLDGRYST